MDPLPCPFCGTQDIEPQRWDLDVLDDPETGEPSYDIRMVMNCPTCGASLVGPDAVADTVDDAEAAASHRVIGRWNKRSHANRLVRDDSPVISTLRSDRPRRAVAEALIEFYDENQKVEECGRNIDLFNPLVHILFGPNVRVNSNGPIVNELIALIDRPTCVIAQGYSLDGSPSEPICSNCGEPIPLDASYCPHCSAEVIGNGFGY